MTLMNSVPDSVLPATVEDDRSDGSVGPCRIALYSHDTMGIGHFRRNLLIARLLSQSPFGATSLIISGAREVALFPRQAGIDCLALPHVYKRVDGQYESGTLGIGFDELIQLRAQTIDAALEAYRPDVLIVDKVPRGIARELDPALRRIRSDGLTRCVLGLRDVLDDPECVRREWAQSRSEEAVDQWYDAVWIYGDRNVYDTIGACGFSARVAKKAAYTGYLDPRIRMEAETCAEFGVPGLSVIPQGPFVLCVVGGGQDGAQLLDAVSQAELPQGMRAVLLTGPFIPNNVRTLLRQRAAENPYLQVSELVTDPERLVASATRVIAMGGYNSVCEVLAYNKSALIVPRVRPRTEQLIRAARLEELGLIDLLHPDDVNPQAVTEWLALESSDSAPAVSQVDMQGHVRLPQLLAELLGRRCQASDLSQSESEATNLVRH